MPEYAPFIFDDFNLCPFPVLSHNKEYDRFSEFYESFEQITELKRALRDPKKNELKRRKPLKVLVNRREASSSHIEIRA